MASIPIADLAKRWLDLDRDKDTRKEIESLLLAGDHDELERRLRKRIAFGTAGLRSSMKAGFAHMNSLTVLQASHGLANYILTQQNISTQDSRLSVVIGYDARHNSEKFARLAAAAFLEKGLKILWFANLVHTPMVPFAVTHHNAAAGIMVTASHNPKNDNGYKVYWSNGCQIIPPHDAGIAAAIEQIGKVDSWDTTLVYKHGDVKTIGHETESHYIHAIGQLLAPTSPEGLDSTPAKQRVVPFAYTAMHGVGLEMIHELIFSRACFGGKDVSMRVVRKQARPDPEFPTVPFPNPEEDGALDIAIAEADKYHCNLVIANDPDADRFAVAVPEPHDAGGWTRLSGNQVGILLASHVMETYEGDRNKLVMLASTVSSRMLAAMAKKEGFHYRETLTGFKWLGNVAQDLQKQGYDPAFAYEEALGYMFPSVVWDKDGIAAAAAFLTARIRWEKQELSPWQKLQQLYETYGYFEDVNTYLISPLPAVTNKVFADIRTSNFGDRPEKVGSRKIVRYRDLTLGYDSGTLDHKPELPVDASAQMITCEIDNGVVFTTRGSGTEPKIKLYIEGMADSSAKAKQLAIDVLQDLLAEWFKPAYYGLHLAGS